MTRSLEKTAVVRKLRCAIYTRKSSEQGLDQEFNSLDAQREACESYIASQRSEGWVLVRDRYDDGGLSGARWSALPCSGSSPTSRMVLSMWSWSTRSTASAAHSLTSPSWPRCSTAMA
ncbi:recombinase family protein [Chelativorans sp. Marseille-P2723]|uniref:recombinase family protein n=1 Tax=Chelativorans sp. Marseille-P2723 TaxID=2709133 RepID=UPI0032B2F6F3